MPRALVTGATGLVGSHIAERLAADGWSVRALVRQHAAEHPRRAAGLRFLTARGVELAQGDTLDERAFTDAASGRDYIFHCAAAITPRGGWESFRATNVDGTQNAIAAAERSGARLLHLSSVAVYGPNARYAPDDRPTDETTPLTPLPERALYARSKRDSESLVMRAHEAGRIWATAVRPDVIYGVRDRQFIPRIARILQRGIVPLVGGGRSTLAIVNAANVADGAILAATSDAAGGQAYNLANDYDVTVRQFFELGAAGLDRRVLLVPVPRVLAAGALVVLKKAMALASGGRMSVMSGASLDFITRDNPFSSERAKRELGWAPRVRPEQSIPEAFRWWKSTQTT